MTERTTTAAQARATVERAQETTEREGIGKGSVQSPTNSDQQRNWEKDVGIEQGE